MDEKVVYILITKSGCMWSVDRACEYLRGTQWSRVAKTQSVLDAFASAFGASDIFKTPQHTLKAAKRSIGVIDEVVNVVTLIQVELEPVLLQRRRQQLLPVVWVGPRQPAQDRA